MAPSPEQLLAAEPPETLAGAVSSTSATNGASASSAVGNGAAHLLAASSAPRGVVRMGGNRHSEEARWRQNSVREFRSPLVPNRLPNASASSSSAAAGASVGVASQQVGFRSQAHPLRDPLAISRTSSSEIPLRSRAPRPNRLESWDSIRSCEFHNDEPRLAQLGPSSGCLAAWWFKLQGWILAIGIGIASSISGALIEVAVNRLSSIRFGWCKSQFFAPQRMCAHDDWAFWGHGTAFFANVGLGTLMAFCSALLVFLFARAASGSGIPEVKTILNGFVMPDVVSLRTLLVKMPGLALSVAAGMSLGKEGPLVHVAVCWAQLFSGIFPQFSNEAKRRELFSAAAAAGVSTAFGAPLGGVLFSLEEVSSIFPAKTLLRSFTAAVSAALMLSVIRGSSQGLTLFSVQYDKPVQSIELVFFALMGVAGGLIGAGFNKVNVAWSSIRMRPGFRKRINGVTEVTLIALVTLVSSWPLMFTRLLSTDVIHALFESCGPGSENQIRTYIGLCSEDTDYAPATASLLLSLFAAGLIRLLQMTITFGTACPAGLFVPSLFIGACFGRCVGNGIRGLNEHYAFVPGASVEPGIYAMVGAAAVLGGVCRVTISLVAIMLELTGGMTYIVPFMLAVLIAKIVGDALNEGIYDLYIVLKGYPFLQEDADVTFDERCCDIMETRLVTLDIALCPRYVDIRDMLQAYGYRGFPVVNGGHFIGFVKRSKLEALLSALAGLDSTDITMTGMGVAGGVSGDQLSPPFQREEDPLPLQMLLPYVDSTVMRMVPDASLAQAHKVFKQLGVRYIFLVGSQGLFPTQDVLQGILSKKKFLLALKSGRVGHMADNPRGVPGWGRQTSGARIQQSLRDADSFAAGVGSPTEASPEASPVNSDEEESSTQPPAARQRQHAH
eukprot:CAMPEP_0203954342 /NCGR_PEP_ID=MMETSP0359-20131031/87411_1 /ASSEMBLY_ACC=CAM_ASM_000338 /TAXON_ID=268821 /ORGANISM="Scrippsiella Hangoei, Strain SHTV-5" /LENGTH=895 /DNA_ID=CAMNT_0050887869 /DNA_START=49 /DNA_END=2736 /DNA_ORIENTATION=+